MKFKVGDRVRIRNDLIYTARAEAYINNLKSKVDGVTTIRGTYEDKYLLRGLPDFQWPEDYLEPIYEPINSRWEILDL